MGRRALLAEPALIYDASSRERSHAGFFCALFRAMDEVNASYCVLARPEAIGNSAEISLAMQRTDKAKLTKTFRILRKRGYLPIRCSEKSVDALLFHFGWLNAGVVDTAVLHVAFGQHVCGRMLISAEALLQGRQRRAHYWSASPVAEFEWLLAKLVADKQLSPPEIERVYELSLLLPEVKAESVAVTLFGRNVGAKIAGLCRKRSINPTISELRRRLWMRSLLQPVQLLHHSVRQVFRSRANSRGALIVLLGPDGSGKSTVAGLLSSSLRPILARQRLYHWRPALLGKGTLGQATTDPHRFAPRDSLTSSLYLAGFFFDHVLGFLLKIRPFLASSGLVVFDRHFCDVVADPRRYRYGGPAWLARLLTQVVPPREKLALILEASDANTVSRKSELSLSEIRRQREAYRKLSFGKSATTRIVATDQGVRSTQNQALSATLEYLADNFLKRYECFN